MWAWVQIPLLTQFLRRSDQSVTASDFGSNGPRFESGRGTLRWVLGQGSLLPLSQGEAFTLASISYLAILVKYILAKKKKKIPNTAVWLFFPSKLLSGPKKKARDDLRLPTMCRRTHQIPVGHCCHCGILWTIRLYRCRSCWAYEARREQGVG